MEPDRGHVNGREELFVSFEGIGPQRHWTALIDIEQDFSSFRDERSNFRVEGWQVRDPGRTEFTQAGVVWRVLDAGMIWLPEQEPRRVTAFGQQAVEKRILRAQPKDAISSRLTPSRQMGGNIRRVEPERV